MSERKLQITHERIVEEAPPNPENLAKLNHPQYQVARHKRRSRNRAKNRVAKKSCRQNR